MKSKIPFRPIMTALMLLLVIWFPVQAEYYSTTLAIALTIISLVLGFLGRQYLIENFKQIDDIISLLFFVGFLLIGIKNVVTKEFDLLSIIALSIVATATVLAIVGILKKRKRGAY